MSDEVTMKLEAIAKASGTALSEVQSAYDSLKKEVTDQLGLSEIDALPIAINRTRVYFKKKILSKSSSKEFVIVGQFKDGVDWAKVYKNQVAEYIKNNSRQAAIEIGALNEDGKYFYRTLNPNKQVEEWKDGKEVYDDDYTADFLVMDSSRKSYHYIAKSRNTEALLAGKHFAIALLEFVPSKNGNKIYETGAPILKSQMDDEEIKKLLFKVYGEHLTTEENLVKYCKTVQRKLVLLENMVVMNLFLRKGDRSPTIVLDINADDALSASVYFPKKTSLNVSEGVPVTILAESGNFDTEKQRCNLTGIAYYVNPKYRSNLNISKISDISRKDGVM